MKLETAAPVRLHSLPVQAASRVWAIGQLLDVTVIGAATRNSMTLRIGALTVEATGVPPLPLGTRFTARVEEMQPRPVLTPVTESAEAPGARIAADALRTLLPRQTDTAPAWRDIEEMTARLQSTSTPQRAPEFVQAARALLAQVPDLVSLDSAQRIAQAVARSGTGLEAALSAQITAGDSRAPDADRKWQLLDLLQRLSTEKLNAMSSARGPVPPQLLPTADADANLSAVSTALPPGPPTDGADIQTFAIAMELKDRVDGLLASITTRQLQSAAAAEQGQLFGLVELPVRLPDGTDVVQLEYSRESAAAGASDSSPHTLLVVVPVAGHELRVRLTLVGDHLSVVAWADDPELRDALETRQGTLASRLETCGFEIGHFVVAPVAGSVKAAHLPHGLIDTLA